MATAINLVLNFWNAVSGHSRPTVQKVVLHDPAARRPHDLDDPFFDENVQIRMADVIADAAERH
jgi:hypothetical protein